MRPKSWQVATTGAVLVLLSTSLGSIVYHRQVSNMSTLEAQAGAVEREVKSSWENFQRADRKFSNAQIQLGIIAAKGTPEPVQLEIMAHNLLGAVLLMTLATAREPTGEPPPDVANAYDLVIDGKTTGYEQLSSEIDTLTRESVSHIKELHDEKSRLESRLNIKRQQLAGTFVWQTTFNLFGLFILLLKDVPIWREQVKKREGALD